MFELNISNKYRSVREGVEPRRSIAYSIDCIMAAFPFFPTISLQLILFIHWPLAWKKIAEYR